MKKLLVSLTCKQNFTMNKIRTPHARDQGYMTPKLSSTSTGIIFKTPAEHLEATFQQHREQFPALLEQSHDHSM